jgi:hypothetical protein
MPFTIPPKVHAWLLELDQQGGENPPDFNYFAALGEVVHRQPHWEYILQTKLLLDKDVQDASHFAELSVHSEPTWDSERNANIIRGLLNIRFSNFGRMVAVNGYEVERWNSVLPNFYKILEDQNYAVVSMDILDMPCDGPGPRGTGWGGLTWFGRFFDYL